MKSSESHCTHELASDARKEKEKEEEKEEKEKEEKEKEEKEKEEKDVMTSKNLTTLTWQVGNKPMPSHVGIQIWVIYYPGSTFFTIYMSDPKIHQYESIPGQTP